ncbi:hypothetical protein [Mucilaginibacter sp.]
MKQKKQKIKTKKSFRAPCRFLTLFGLHPQKAKPAFPPALARFFVGPLRSFVLGGNTSHIVLLVFGSSLGVAEGENCLKN